MPTLALILVYANTFYARHKAVLWLVALLMGVGVVAAAGWLLERSLRRADAHQRRRQCRPSPL